MKLYPIAFIACIAVGIASCNSAPDSSTPDSTMPAGFPEFFKEGHRGTRGLMPENTIVSMQKAVAVGANVIEVDVYTTKDGKVLVAHDPYVNTKFTLTGNGQEIPAEEARKYIFHQMNYADIRPFDVGSKQYSAFPQQEKIKTYMPLLDELIDSVEAYTKAHGLPPTIYNIELKTNPRYDSLRYNCTPREMVDAVMQVVKSKNIGRRYYIQSFDFRPLQYAHKQYPEVVIGFLTSSKKLTLDDNLEKLGFKPNLYSPEYRLVTKEMVASCQQHGMKLVPWTVNTAEEMKTLIELGVNGIITDYPNLFELVRVE